MAADGELRYDVTADSKGFEGTLTGATRLISRMGTAITAAVGLSGGLAAIGKSLSSAAAFESTTVAFRTLIGDAARADTALKSIKSLAASTPFEFPELADAGRKLIAFGQQAEAVPAVLTMIGDVASGVQAPIGEIAELFGKAQVAGTLYAEDINQLVGRGIPVIQEFAKQLGVSEAEVKKMASEGKISFDSLQLAFSDLTKQGGKFHGMMAAQSRTTAGLLSTIRSEVNEIFTTLGTPINDSLKPVLEGAIENIQTLGAGLAAAIGVVQGALASGRLGELLAASLKLAAAEGTNAIIAGNVAQLRFIAGGIRGLITQMGTGMGEALSGSAGAFLIDMVAGIVQMGTNLRTVLTVAFKSATAFFQAAALAVIEQLKEQIGKIPGLGKSLKGFEARSFDQIYAQQRAARGPDDINLTTAPLDRGAAFLKEKIDAAGTAVADYAKRIAAGGEAIDTSGIRADIADLAKAVAPDAWKDFLGAVKGAADPIKKGAEEAGKAIAAGVPGAIGKETEGADADAAAKKKIRLFGLDESEQRRRERMSDADKKKLAEGGSLLGAVTPSPRGLLPRAAATAAAGAPAVTPPPSRGRAAEISRPSGESRLLEVLKEIAGNTAPLKQVAAA